MPEKTNHYKFIDIQRYFPKKSWVFGITFCHEDDECYLNIMLFKINIAIGKLYDYDWGVSKDEYN